MRSGGLSFPRPRGSPSTRIGAPTRFAPTGSREGWRSEAVRRRAGNGPSESTRAAGLPSTFRAPPAPYRDERFSRGPGHCCVCGQPVFRLGWHCDLWGRGPNPNAGWHAGCVIAWRLWNAPSDFVQVLKRRQMRRCAQTGARLWKTAEVDHRMPLFQVWREHRNTSWPELLAFWGVPNLQVINQDAHVAKCAAEAQYRGQRQAAAR